MNDRNETRIAPVDAAEPMGLASAPAVDVTTSAPSGLNGDPGPRPGLGASGAPETPGLTESAAPREKNAVWDVIRVALALAIAGLAWFIPGGGHLLLRRWQRALAFFLVVGGLSVSGYLMRGNVFHAHSTDPFGTLGFLADAGSGVFYLLSRAIESAGPNVSRAIGDYGTRFIAAAGIVNVLGVCDAYEIARGRRR